MGRVCHTGPSLYRLINKLTMPTYVQHYHRKMIETVGSLIERMLPKTIHAVTAEGFELKILLFVLAHSFNYL